jgi:hypothetical protein
LFQQLEPRVKAHDSKRRLLCFYDGSRTVLPPFEGKSGHP